MPRQNARAVCEREPEFEQALRAGYLQFLPRLAKAYLLVLRAASAVTGWDFSEDEWSAFARLHDLPVASTFARSAGGGSFAFAKFLAAVGPLPPHPGGPRYGGRRLQVRGWDDEQLILGAATVARINGGWPSLARFDDAAGKARDRGVNVPLIDVIERRTGLKYRELQAVAETLVGSIGREQGPRYGFLPTYEDADAVARKMALGIELLAGDRPSSDVWDKVTAVFRKRGVPSLWKIEKTFGTWQASWAHVADLGLDAGVQADQRPRYGGAEGVARGLALAEDALGFRPRPSEWTDAVRALKRKLDAGVIPAKPTVYYYFPSWKAAWATVDALRARGVI